MKTENLNKIEETMYTAPQCLRSDPGKNGVEYAVISDKIIKPGSRFYYGITGKFYIVKKILEVRPAKVGPGDVYAVSANIEQLED